MRELNAVRVFHESKTNRSWTRDYLPDLCSRRGGSGGVLELAIQWLGEIPELACGRCRNALSGRQSGWPIWTPGRRARVVLEGGSIDVNGAGSILTTEECLLSPVQARNPGLSRAADGTAVFAITWERDTRLWLRNGIAGDDTHGHVDDLARFTDERTVVIASEQDPGESELRTAYRKIWRCCANARPGRRPASRRNTSDARAGLFRRAAIAGELCEFLYCEQAWCWCRRSTIPTIAWR